MRRGELYRVRRPGSDDNVGDPKSFRVFVVVSRQVLLDSRFSTAVCAPVFSSGEGLSTQVAVGPEEGLKHESWIMCDNLVSLRKSDLTQFVGSLSRTKIAQLNQSLRAALALD
ncbi:MAG: type II toxin-antitoxin system PemK/MazF family toxin [Acidobacteriia bacterium]|nr:type II toxin-antitoxin system PemK/MazF family toxin [Terriglobia bacterium]